MITIKPEWEINKFETEKQFQASYVIVFSQLFPRLRGLAWHTPNEGYITKLESETQIQYRQRCLRQGNTMKAQGVISGISDWIFIWNGIIYIQELKLPKGVLSESQKDFFERCTRQCPQNPPVVIKTIAEGLRHTESVITRNLKIDFSR